MNNSDRPAFPVSGSYGEEATSLIVAIEYGITKREYYAGLAMQGILAYPHHEDIDDLQYKRNAEKAVHYADALIKALENIKTNNQ